MWIGPTRENQPADRKLIRSARGAKGTPPTDSTAPSSESEAVSSEQSALLARLRALPEVRPEVVEEAKRRVRDGELLTRQSAEQTAEAILAEQDREGQEG